MKKRIVVWFALLGVLLLAAAPIAVAGRTVDLIIQAGSADAAAQIAAEYGARIDETLPIIDAVAVAMPEARVDGLRADSRVVAVHQNYEMSHRGRAGRELSPGHGRGRGLGGTGQRAARDRRRGRLRHFAQLRLVAFSES